MHIQMQHITFPSCSQWRSISTKCQNG